MDAKGEAQGARIVVVSDSTAETAWRMAKSALLQFADLPHEVRRIPEIRTADEVEEAVALARDWPADLVLHTFADADMGQTMTQALDAVGLQGLDLIGPVLDRLSDLFGCRPSAVPGAQHRWTQAYDRRIAAIEYAVKHDDGMGRITWERADIVLLGPSRTGKTPLSMVLANEGYKVANVPFIPDMPLPDGLADLAGPLIVGLLSDAVPLARLREQEVLRSGADRKHSRYAEHAEVERELNRAAEVFRGHGWPVVHVAGKAIEELAVEVLSLIESEGIRLLRDPSTTA